MLLLVGTQFISPAAVLGFQAIPDFDAAFMVMTVGMLLSSRPGWRRAYRARGLYGQAVRLQNWGAQLAQLGQFAATSAHCSLFSGHRCALPVSVLARRARHSWSWMFGLFRKAAPFAVAGATELALINLPVLLVSALVSDCMAVAQWGLTRIVAGLLRMLCVQTALPLAAELGQDYAIGLKEQLCSLYAGGSVFVTLQASVVVSGLLPFWPDFFALWTHGTVPYAPSLFWCGRRAYSCPFS
ncbi:hypothetical protein [Bradyrhizobium sp. JYMT SZCCT0428]|uniref:hypothetical protein n=1 Tax=Bradyrhizobium sp. JYMT SZCCT0428 TaxID=2807673 RepID=UPI001BA4F233|nr:hypothetical protein [Bradyrhizobium sp. JYMT SZCCT0428]MBR1152659.1 hypothetical protein [Bradyrhizobium sp. JYMT SZCCT0428]